MANVKISDLNEYVDAQSTDVVPCVDLVNDQTKKIKIESIAKANADGTAASPSVVFASDKDTGIYRPTTNQFGISTGGTSRFVIDSSGNITISGNLSVSGTTTANITLADNSVNGDKLTNDITIANNLTVTNDLTVNGTTTTINSTTLQVDDKNIELGTVATPSDTTADGGGITLKGATDKTLTWIDSTDCWTFNQGLNLTAGTAAAPALIFNGDVNSGLFQPAGDSLAIATGGTQRMTIGTTGNVGIGTSSPQEKLHVNGDILIRSDTPNLKLQSPNSSNPYYVAANVSDAVDGGIVIGRGSDLNSGSNLLVIKPSGNVGIGTSTPQAKLHVIDDSSLGIRSQSASAQATDTNKALHVSNGNTTDTFNVSYKGAGYFAGNVGIGTASPTQKLDVVGSATFSSRVDANKFRSLSSGSASAPTICPGYDNDTGLFHPATNNIGFTTNGSEKMRIEAGGNVGIKQSSPDHLLHIGDTTNVLGGTANDQLDNLTIQSDTANTDYLNFTVKRISTGSDWTTAAQRIQRKVDVTLMGYIQFGNYNSDLITFGEGNTEYGRFDGSGNFGIGTDDPQAKLHVRGGDAISSRAYFERTGTNASTAFIGLDGAGAAFGSITNSNLSFYTGQNNLRMVVQDSTGNVGIGTSSPQQDLHVSGTTSFIRVEGTNNASGSDVAALEIKTFSARAGGVKGLDDSDNELWFIGRHYNGGSAATRLDFDVAGSTAMSIPTDGDVGIGTTSPQAKLDVNGTAFVGEGGEDNEILRLNTDRTWSFFQRGSGAQTSLDLASSDNKNFTISSLKTGETSASASVFINGSNGNVGIGTDGPKLKLDVNGSILSTPIAYSNNQDEAYFIAGTSGWTGATTNWNTFGFQHRIKTNNVGIPRITIDTSGGEVFCVTSQHKVGIGTTNPTQELDVNGTIEANDLTINGSSFRNIPKNSKTAAYTLLVSDLGKVVCITTGGVTIPSGVFSSGDAVTIYNDSGSNQTITQGSSVTLRTAGTSTAGNKTLAGYGLCTVLCVASNVFVVGGAGLS